MKVTLPVWKWDAIYRGMDAKHGSVHDELMEAIEEEVYQIDVTIDMDSEMAEMVEEMSENL